MRNRSRSTYHYTVEDGVVCVVDHDIGMSVTNNAENVIADLAEILDLSKLRVIYRDTEGTWDGLLVKDGRFDTFLHLGCRDKEAAKREAVARRSH